MTHRHHKGNLGSSDKLEKLSLALRFSFVKHRPTTKFVERIRKQQFHVNHGFFILPILALKTQHRDYGSGKALCS